MSIQLIQGDARHIPLRDGSVHCVVTSPPYWGLRDYGTARWEGGDAGCDHMRPGPKDRSAATPRDGYQDGFRHGTNDTDHAQEPYRDLCGKCSARRIDRQIGLEPTPDEFVATMVRVFREVWRVLRDDGTCWLNLGDSYATGMFSHEYPRKITQPNNGWEGTKLESRKTHVGNTVVPRNPFGLKPKDLIGIPWRVALALQADGWWLRSDIIWAKLNPMPESVTDRPTKSHEYMFLLSKSEKYYFDQEAVREQGDPSTLKMNPRYARISPENPYTCNAADAPDGVRRGNSKTLTHFDGMRNIRTVWSIATEAYPGAHFATYPRRLVEPCVKAGCPEGGIVLDLFCGSGTTLVVANALGRRAIGCDLSREYLGLATRRLSRPHAPVSRPAREEFHPLFAEAL